MGCDKLKIALMMDRPFAVDDVGIADMGGNVKTELMIAALLIDRWILLPVWEHLEM